MFTRTTSNRIKAAAIAALMCLSIASTTIPIATGSTMDVHAAAVTVGEELDSASKTGNVYKGNVKDLGVTDLTKLTFTVEAPYTGNMSYGFGISTAEDPYWMEYDGKGWVDTEGGTVEVPGIEVEVTEGAKTTITIDTSKIEVSPTGTFEFRNYYSADWSSGKENKVPITLVSVEGTGTAATDDPVTDDPEDPKTDDPEDPKTDDPEDPKTDDPADPKTDDPEDPKTDDPADPKTDPETPADSNTNVKLKEKDVFEGFWADYASSGIKNVAITFTADYTGSTSIGMGIGTAAEPYWYEWDAAKEAWIDTKGGTVEAPGWSIAVEEGGTYTVVFDTSKYELSYNPKTDKYPGHFEFRNYYGGEDHKGTITVTNVEVNTKKTSDVTAPEEPVSDADSHEKAAHSGDTVNPTTGDKWTYKDGVLSATLARQQEFEKPLTLTRGYDEEYYILEDKKPEEGVDPMNAHKFSYNSFGLSNIGETVTIQSLMATITSEGAPLKSFMYGGGLNVKNESPADTESAKRKAGVALTDDAGYWYNDMGEDKIEEYQEKGVEFGIEPRYGYFLSSEDNQLGEYFTVYWDVMDEVKPYEENGDLSFQYWYGVEDTEEYTEVESVDLLGGILTYTQTETIKNPGVKSVTIGEDVKEGKFSGEISYADAGLDAWNEVKAVVFTLDVSGDLDKLVYGVGTSVGDDFKTFSPEDENWDYVMLNTKKGEVQIVWFVPTGVTPNAEFGNVQFGYWYGADDGKELGSVTLKSADIYYSEGTKPVEPEPVDDFVPLYGDANCDGEVDIIDVIVTNKYLLGSGELTDHGKINANVDLVNEAIDTTDSLDILKLVVELLTQADMPIKG